MRVLGNVRQTDIDNEIRAVNKLCKSSHPNIVQVLGLGQLRPDSTWFYIDMELCSISLETYMNADESLASLPKWVSESLQICDIFTQILNGLAFIHENGEVHRDLSPQNGTRIEIESDLIPTSSLFS